MSVRRHRCVEAPALSRAQALQCSRKGTRILFDRLHSQARKWRRRASRALGVQRMSYPGRSLVHLSAVEKRFVRRQSIASTDRIDGEQRYERSAHAGRLRGRPLVAFPLPCRVRVDLVCTLDESTHCWWRAGAVQMSTMTLLGRLQKSRGARGHSLSSDLAEVGCDGLVQVFASAWKQA